MRTGGILTGMITLHYIRPLAGCTLALAMAASFTACKPQPTAEAPVSVARQGSSFDEPVTTTTSTQAANAELATADAGSSPTELVLPPAKASDIPADIASIPSATPVPRPEASEVVNAAGGNPAPAAEPAAAVAEGDYKPVNFQLLSSYKYVEPIPTEGARPEEVEAKRKKNQIPENIVALNGSKAMVEGWMVPMQVNDDGGVKSFVLVKTQPQCCFGDTQAMNEWIDVTMPEGQTAEFNVDRPIKVFGELEVGEKLEDGFVLSIYRMKAAKVSS